MAKEVGIAGPVHQAFLIGINGFFVFFLFEICITEVVVGVGTFCGCFCSSCGFFKALMRKGISPLPVKSVAQVVDCFRIVIVFFECIKIMLQCISVPRIRIIFVSFPQQLVRCLCIQTDAEKAS